MTNTDQIAKGAQNHQIRWQICFVDEELEDKNGRTDGTDQHDGNHVEGPFTNLF